MSTIFDSIGIDPGIVIIILLIVVLVLIASTVSSNMRLTRLERKYKMFMKGSDAQSLEKLSFVNLHRSIIFLRQKRIMKRQYALWQNISNYFTASMVLEKYDAFDDVGGKLSFALALLDRENTGLILNAVHSRDNCFLYLKEIVKGESYVMLSQEEVEALRKAVNFGLGEVNEGETTKK